MAKRKTDLFTLTFIRGYMHNGLTLGQAYNEALKEEGSKPQTMNVASQSGHRMYHRPEVQAMIQKEKEVLKKQLDDKYAKDRLKIVNNLWKLYEKAIEEQTTLSRSGKPTNHYDVNSLPVAQKILEQLSKITGMNVDRVENTNVNTSEIKIGFE